MLKRPLLGMAAAFLLGIWIAAGGNGILAVLVLVLGAVTAGILLYHSNARVIMGIRLLLLLLGGMLGAFRYQSENDFRMIYLSKISDGEEITLQGTLTQKEYKNYQYIYHLSAPYFRAGQKGQEISGKANEVLVYLDSGETVLGNIGEILVIHGTISLWKHAANEGSFDEAEFYLSKKQDFKVENASVLGIYGKADFFGEELYRLKQRLLQVYENSLAESGVLITMLLGDKSLLETEVRELYQKAGILHITCISGLHFAVIGMTLYQFLRKRRLGAMISAAAAGAVILCYGSMVGAGVSAKRAIGMFLLTLLAPVVGRTYDSLNGLGMMMLFLLWENPFLYHYAGFLFSCAAVVGVVWLGKCRGKKEKLTGLYQGMAIQLSTLPFAAWYYYEIPLYGVFVNLLVLPFLKLLLLFGIFGGFAGLFSMTMAKVLLFPCHIVLSGYLKICQLTEQLPGAMLITGKPGMVRVIIYFILLLTWNYLRLCHDRAKELREEAAKLAGEEGKENKSPVPYALKNILCALLFFVILFYPQKRSFELTMLDVGQGDGSFIRTGSGVTLFVDGGSTSVSKVGEYRILPFLKYNGVREIDCWFVSHTDEDHISGLEELLNLHYPIGTLIFSEITEQEDTCLRLQELAKKNNTRLLFLKNGDRLHLGDATVTAMLPEIAGGDKNEESMVMLYEEEEFTALFTGDIGKSREEALIAEGELQSVDFYKAAHHGSNGSNTLAFLQELNPKAAGISCASKNSYGHPGEEAVERMEAVGSSLFYTMEAGQIRLTCEDSSFFVEKYLAPLEVYDFPLYNK